LEAALDEKGNGWQFQCPLAMAETPAKRTVAISVIRKRPFRVKAVLATAFSLRYDKNGVLDLRFEALGASPERVLFDPVILEGNLDLLKAYITRMPGDQDDASLKEEIMAAPGLISNILHFCHIGQRAEAIFGLVCLAEWLEAGRKGAPTEIDSSDVLVVYSTKEMQKKMLLEIITVLGRQAAT
jgi:hypothetical protein